MISRKNANTIVDHILAMNWEVHVSDNYRRDNIMTLKKLAEESSNGDNNDKLFQDLERKDVITFLDRYRKPEDVDPMHTWIGTCNQTLMRISRFFKWF